MSSVTVNLQPEDKHKEHTTNSLRYKLLVCAVTWIPTLNA